MDISIFENAKSVIPSGTITINDFLTHIKLGKWKSLVEKIRNEPEKEIRKNLKEKLPAVTISGTFTQRNEKSLIKHSGFICIDIDNFVDKNLLLTDPYTYAVFSSASGAGLAVLVKIDAKKHKESFKWLRNYYFENFGIVVDNAPSNWASLRFVSYDANIYINEKSKQSNFQKKEPIKINSLPIIMPKDRVGEMVRDAVSRRINIAEDYHSYLTLGFALASGFGENGREYFHALAGTSSKYNSQHAEKQYNYCLRNPNGGVSVGSFYWMLKNAGIKFPKDEKYETAVRVSAIAKKAGRNQAGTAEQLQQINGIPREDAIKIVKEVFERPDISLSSIAADPEKLIESLFSWMEINHPMKKNCITGKIEENGIEVSKERMNTIYLRARSVFNTPNVTYDLIERIIFSDFCQSYNPLIDYIEKNRYRNTTGNITRMIESIKSPTPHAGLFIRKWLISIPAAIQGTPVRLVLALVGKQHNGKTETFRRLLPEKLKKYYGESKMDAGKDDELLMCQKLILMDDEMGGKSRQDEKRFKDLTSKHTFTLRAPYGRYNEDYKRLAVLCGTSNDKEVINDPTGNTRILPVEVEYIDYEAYNSIDKDELFMEIVRAYESGEDWNFTNGEFEKLSEVTNKYEQIPYERELILKYFTTYKDNGDFGIEEEMTATEIKDFIETHSKQQIRNLKRLGMELRNIFGERVCKRVGGKVLNLYKVIKNENSSMGGVTIPEYAKNENFYESEKDDTPF